MADQKASEVDTAVPSQGNGTVGSITDKCECLSHRTGTMMPPVIFYDDMQVFRFQDTENTTFALVGPNKPGWCALRDGLQAIRMQSEGDEAASTREWIKSQDPDYCDRLISLKVVSTGTYKSFKDGEEPLESDTFTLDSSNNVRAESERYTAWFDSVDKALSFVPTSQADLGSNPPGAAQ
ncbi:hypothetical protein BD324DRAFT_638622 [Kockovaella imperatae]|uniref:Uncharacterized protein n=1 Tax=Kockovaella imperatae TaxID=4999 RepID=A0A1Y1U703_9TREE|nr:hypothetical protein BD324DRAFT_638622 [Kockovaella imperatae]ORX33798.1 hypothetical protein BD324DRAFT_638622 [Kockovaella imperatae]